MRGGGEKNKKLQTCDGVLCHKEELQKRIVEEQQNNNLSVEILNGNAESLTGLVGNAHALKEPGMDHSLCQYYGSAFVVCKWEASCYPVVYSNTEMSCIVSLTFSFCPFQTLLEPRMCKGYFCLKSTVFSTNIPAVSFGCMTVHSLLFLNGQNLLVTS